ncbi:MAG: TerB family tellurite resistance protein [Alphaproteobacteria bacterium]|nr:TerB family tellurite resistance protein [Alphaproteobacteria bacterium]MCB9693289.1 TerB family tellurite resistance protein [Alphaproteobacteria bacterium]
MELKDLTTAEQVALVALAKHLVRADGHVSKSEVLDLMEIANALGPLAFARAMEGTKDRYESLDQALEIAMAVRRPEARRLIMTVLTAIAEGDTEDAREDHVLVSLQRRWNIAVDY